MLKIAEIPKIKLDYALLFLKCLLLLSFVRVTITFKSYKEFTKYISSIYGHTKTSRNPVYYARAIKRASRFIPKATCLTQALALKWLIARSGKDSVIRIGVMPDESSNIKAHAWVMYQGQVILGGDEKNFEAFIKITEI